MIRANHIPGRRRYRTPQQKREAALPVAIRLSVPDFARLCAIKPHKLKPGEVPTLPGSGLRLYPDPSTRDGEAALLTQEEEREVRREIELSLLWNH